MTFHVNLYYNLIDLNINNKLELKNNSTFRDILINSKLHLLRDLLMSSRALIH